MKNNIYIAKSVTIVALLASVFLSSCDSYLEPDAPINSFTGDNVFLSEDTAIAAVNGVYSNMIGDTYLGIISNGTLGVIGGLCADELNDNTFNYSDYFQNKIIKDGFNPNSYLWSNTYANIYRINANIIGITASEALTEDVKNQLLGELYFLRGFSYFYLTNMYGDVPIITGLDYTKNKDASRDSSSDVYDFVLQDLELAKSLLVPSYPSDERGKPNKYAATALLARVKLYVNDFDGAAEEATEVINASSVYKLADITQVFKKTSEETIWQLVPVITWLPNALDASFYDPNYNYSPTYTITDNLLNAFEAGDARKSNWVGEYVDFYTNETINYPAKYTQTYETPATEYKIVLRLDEQYLIRAEARIKGTVKDLTGAVSDLDAIRERASLNGYTGALDPDAILDAIVQERRVELFAEWGHRWFDLKRTNTIDTVMGTAKPTTWETWAKLWPVPQNEISANSNLLPQNEGYN